jgi:hypothetical protein
MGLRSTLASLVSAPLLAVLEERLREIIDQQTDARGFADPASIRDLNAHVANARKAVTELAADLAAQSQAIAELNQSVDDDEPEFDDIGLRLAGLDARDEQIRDGLDHATSDTRKLADKITALRASLDRASSKLDGTEALAQRAAVAAESSAASLAGLAQAPATSSVAAAPARRAKADKGCKVEDCDGKHRARGFCGRHYQMWKRATLPGFVSGDGTVHFVEDGPTFQLDKNLSGAAAAQAGGAILIDGQKVSSTAI